MLAATDGPGRGTTLQARANDDQDEGKNFGAKPGGDAKQGYQRSDGGGRRADVSGMSVTPTPRPVPTKNQAEHEVRPRTGANWMSAPAAKRSEANQVIERDSVDEAGSAG